MALLRSSTRDFYSQLNIVTSWQLENSHNREKYPQYDGLPHIYSEPSCHANQTNFPRSIQWSYDGTSLVSMHEDFGLRVFILDHDILQDQDHNLDTPGSALVPINRIIQPTSPLSYALNPGFSYYDEQEHNNVLISRRNVPIKLLDLTPSFSEQTEEADTDQDPVIQSFFFIDSRHDKLLETTALTFEHELTFVAGSSKGLVAQFDINRPREPSSVFVLGCRSVVSCLSNSKSEFTNDCIYAGTYVKNSVSLLDPRTSEVVVNANIAKGNGVTQIVESQNGRYIYPICRRSDEIPVLDCRMSLERVATLKKFNCGSTNQKIFADILPNRGLIAGSAREGVKFWTDAELGVDCEPDVSIIPRLEGGNVSSILCNPEDCSIIATSSGCREHLGDDVFSGIQVWQRNEL